MYAACVGISGYVPLPLTGDDYIELLPAVFRTTNDYGLTIDNRTYDCKPSTPAGAWTRACPAETGRNGRSTSTLRHHPRLAARPPRRGVDHCPMGSAAPWQASPSVTTATWDWLSNAGESC